MGLLYGSGSIAPAVLQQPTWPCRSIVLGCRRRKAEQAGLSWVRCSTTSARQATPHSIDAQRGGHNALPAYTYQFTSVSIESPLLLASKGEDAVPVPTRGFPAVGALARDFRRGRQGGQAGSKGSSRLFPPSGSSSSLSPPFRWTNATMRKDVSASHLPLMLQLRPSLPWIRPSSPPRRP